MKIFRPIFVLLAVLALALGGVFAPATHTLAKAPGPQLYGTYSGDYTDTYQQIAPLASYVAQLKCETNYNYNYITVANNSWPLSSPNCLQSTYGTDPTSWWKITWYGCTGSGTFQMTCGGNMTVCEAGVCGCMYNRTRFDAYNDITKDDSYKSTSGC